MIKKLWAAQKLSLAPKTLFEIPSSPEVFLQKKHFADFFYWWNLLLNLVLENHMNRNVIFSAD